MLNISLALKDAPNLITPHPSWVKSARELTRLSHHIRMFEKHYWCLIWCGIPHFYTRVRRRIACIVLLQFWDLLGCSAPIPLINYAPHRSPLYLWMADVFKFTERATWLENKYLALVERQGFWVSSFVLKVRLWAMLGRISQASAQEQEIPCFKPCAPFGHSLRSHP